MSYVIERHYYRDGGTREETVVADLNIDDILGLLPETDLPLRHVAISVKFTQTDSGYAATSARAYMTTGPKR